MNYQGEAYDDLVLFQNVPYELVQDILAGCLVETLEPEEVLLEPRKDNDLLYHVLDGFLTVHLESLESDFIASIVRGSCVGELSIVDEKHATAFVKARMKTRLLVIDKFSLRQLLGSSMEFMFNLLRLFSGRMRFNLEALAESQLIRTVPDIIYRLDKEGNFIYLNKSIEKFGYKVSDLLGKHFSALVSDEEISKVSYSHIMDKVKLTGEFPKISPKLFDERRGDDRKTTGLELKLKRKDTQVLEPSDLDGFSDEMIYADVSCTGLKNSFEKSHKDSYLGTIGIIRDVTERKMYQAKIAEQKARMEAIFDTMADAIIVINSKGVIESINHSTSYIFGYSEEELIGNNVSMLMPSPNRENHDGYLKKYLESGKSIALGSRQETVGRRKDGREFEMDLAVTEVRLNNRILFTGILRDITERKESERIIQYQANYDALTKLPNRSFFMESMEKAMHQAKGRGEVLGLVFIDLDRFKWVNDTLGHAAGDELLRMAGKRLKGCVKSEDMIARLGGDEFTALLKNVGNSDNVALMAKRILEQLNQPFRWDGKDLFISGSLGVALMPSDTEDLETLLKKADEAMYRSKKAGRNAYHFFSGESLILPKKY